MNFPAAALVFDPQEEAVVVDAIDETTRLVAISALAESYDGVAVDSDRGIAGVVRAGASRDEDPSTSDSPSHDATTASTPTTGSS